MIRRAHWPRPQWGGLAWYTGTEMVNHDTPDDGGGPVGYMSMPNRQRFVGAVPVAMAEQKPRAGLFSLTVARAAKR